jgi:hypothetical protein
MGLEYWLRGRLLVIVCGGCGSPMHPPHTPVERHFLILYALIKHCMFASGIQNLRIALSNGALRGIHGASDIPSDCELQPVLLSFCLVHSQLVLVFIPVLGLN